METTNNDAPADQRSIAPSGLDITMAVLSVVLVGGFYIDLWAHSHGRVDETFFTPWHGILYAGAGVITGVLVALAWRGRREGKPWSRVLPAGYGLSLIGGALFLLAGIGDLAWHEAFGFEENVEDLLSPTHLALATAGVLMVSGPIRSTWIRGVPDRFPAWLPWVVSLTMLFSILTAFTSYAHPAVSTWPAAPEARVAPSTLLAVDLTTGAQTRVPLDIGETVWMPATFPDGERIVVSAATDGRGSLHVINLVTGDHDLLWEGDGPFNHPHVSPDGSLITFTAETDDTSAEIFVIPSAGGGASQLTVTDGFSWGSAWSPDGQELVFVSDVTGSEDLYVMNADGSNVRLVVALPGTQSAPDWSPDGSLLVFQSTHEDDNFDIYTSRPDGSSLTRLTRDEGDDISPAWSPDGSRIAFSSPRDFDFDLFTVSSGGATISKLADNPSADEGWGGIAWVPDGSAVVTNTSGWPPPWGARETRDTLAVTAIVIQALLIAGVLLLILRTRRYPIGAMTLLLTVNGAMMGVFSDNYWYVIPAFLTGLFADGLVALSDAPQRVGAARVAAFTVPFVWYAIYLLMLVAVTDGLEWSTHMTTGGPVLAGIAGLLLSFVAYRPGRTAPTRSA